MRARSILFVALPILIAACQPDVVVDRPENAASDVKSTRPGVKPDAPATKEEESFDFPELPELDEQVESVLSSSGVPGASVAIVKDGKIAFAKGYGKARLEPAMEMKYDTQVNIASISKLFTALAAMKLVEAGKLDLDADVSKVLGFDLRNPRFASTPITLRMLLSHTSSIDSTGDSMSDPIEGNFVEGKDATTSLKTLVEDTFTPGKRWYSDAHYTSSKPGSAWKYCNMCPAITAVMVEKASGKAFDAFSKDTIFKPLGMASTTWRIAEVDEKRLAIGYSTWDGPMTAVKPQGHVYYPSVTLRTSAVDLARFILEFTSKHAVIKEATFQQMIEEQSSSEEDMRLGFMGEPGASPSMIGHNGSDAGQSANLVFDVESGTGVLVMLNGDAGGDEQEPPFLQIQNALLEAADGL